MPLEQHEDPGSNRSGPFPDFSEMTRGLRTERSKVETEIFDADFRQKKSATRLSVKIFGAEFSVGGSLSSGLRFAPGTNCVSVLKFLYSKKTFERVFEQAIVDMREEHAEALSKQHTWHAHWIHARGLLILLATMIAHIVATCGKTVAKIWKLTP